MSIYIQTDRGGVKVASSSTYEYPEIKLGRVKGNIQETTIKDVEIKQYFSSSTLDTLKELSCWTKTHSETNKTTNCHNCGAPITSSKCEYCETDFEQSAIYGMTK